MRATKRTHWSAAPPLRTAADAHTADRQILEHGGVAARREVHGKRRPQPDAHLTSSAELERGGGIETAPLRGENLQLEREARLLAQHLDQRGFREAEQPRFPLGTCRRMAPKLVEQTHLAEEVPRAEAATAAASACPPRHGRRRSSRPPPGRRHRPRRRAERPGSRRPRRARSAMTVRGGRAARPSKPARTPLRPRMGWVTGED